MKPKRKRQPRPKANLRAWDEVAPDRLRLGLSLLARPRGLPDKLTHDDMPVTEIVKRAKKGHPELFNDLRREAETHGLSWERQLELLDHIEDAELRPKSRRSGRPSKAERGEARDHDLIRLGCWTLMNASFTEDEAIQILANKYNRDLETVRNHVERSRQPRKSRGKSRA